MKYLSTVAFAALSLPAFAGHPIVEDKNFSEPLYGVGFYGALQVGANLYQDYDSGNVDAGGLNIGLDLDSKVGGLVGLKLGYVFGTGSVRPAIEFDGYFNAFEPELDLRVTGPGGTFRRDGDVSFTTGAFLANFLLRVNCQSPVQLYFGGGVGIYVADVEVDIGGVSDNDDSTDLAWQLIAGADYYISERSSLFVEYKFLNYEGDDFQGVDGTIRQQLLGLGLRVHF